MNVSYFGAFVHGFILLMIFVNGVWSNRRFSIPMIAILVLLASRVALYTYATFHPAVSDASPASFANASLLGVELVTSMWHVLTAARVSRSKRFVVCTMAASTVAINILVGSGGKESCSFFAPIGYILIVASFLLLARAIRSGSNPYSLQHRRIPIELVAFHFISILILLTATIRSDACLNKTTQKGLGASIVLADVFALAPILISTWLKMDELLDTDDYDDDDDGDGAL